jgi:hypothetical protein
MRFREWFLFESSGGRLLLSKAVDARGLESIRSSGFSLQSRHFSSAGEYYRHGDTTTEQQYGPGLYFGIVPSEDFARKNCRDYAETWGNHILIASLKSGARGLITTWLPEGHPIWSFSASKGNSSDPRPTTHEQLVALGLSDLFPDYGPNNTHSPPEWGYRIKGRVDFWAHEHNGRPHMVVYNPSVLEFVSDFECGTDRPHGTMRAVAPKESPKPAYRSPAWERMAKAGGISPSVRKPGGDDLSLDEF